MKRQARVVSTTSNEGATVELESLAQCRRCSRGQGCGALMLQPDSASGVFRMLCSASVSQGLQPVVGERVLIEIDEGGSSWLLLVFGAYGLPLVGMLLAAASMVWLTSSPGLSVANGTAVFAELMVLLASVCGLVGGFFAWRLLAPHALAAAKPSLCLKSARIVAINTNE